MTPALVLVVDDNAANLKLMRLVLAAAGFEVRTAATGAEALHLVATESPDLVLMDVQLPDIDGLACTRQIKGSPATRHIPVLAVTAYAMRGDAEAARAAGCDDYITKPIDTRALAGRVARHLASARGATPRSEEGP